jgi:hypothetical protein
MGPPAGVQPSESAAGCSALVAAVYSLQQLRATLACSPVSALESLAVPELLEVQVQRALQRLLAWVPASAARVLEQQPAEQEQPLERPVWPVRPCATVHVLRVKFP